MDPLSEIRAILSQSSETPITEDTNLDEGSDAGSKQKANLSTVRSQSSGGKTPGASKPEEILTAPGSNELKKAAGSTSKTSPPESKGGKSSSSASNRLHAEAEDTRDDEDGDKDDKKSGGKEDRFAKFRKMAKDKLKAKKDGDGKTSGKESEEESVKKESVFDNVDIASHIDALFSGEETLTEDFKSKAKTIFEAALSERENDLRDAIVEEYDAVVEEGILTVQLELAEKLDSYLNYVVEQWMVENRLEVENGIRTEIAESFLGGLRNLFLEHDIDVPESKVDLVDELSQKVQNLESRLNEEIIANVELSEKIETFSKKSIVAELGEGLATSQLEKFVQLTENVSYQDEADFRKKVNTIKESYFTKSSKSTPVTKTAMIAESAVIDDESPETTTDTNEGAGSEEMQRLAKALSQFKGR